MIANEKLRTVVIAGLQDYLNIPVIKGNQNAEHPDYPYLSFNITTLESVNNGTWGAYADETDRIAVKQTWSITVQSDNDLEAAELASKARQYLTHTGRIYLNDNDVIVESVTNITNRDSIISIEYEYKYGFDAVFYMFNEETNPTCETGYIETIVLKEKEQEEI